MKPRKKPEKAIERDCLVWLNQNGWYAWKNKSTGTYSQKLGRWLKPEAFAINGVSDIIAFNDGRTIFIEVKDATGVHSDDQQLFERQCEKHGVTYLLVRSKEEMITSLAWVATDRERPQPESRRKRSR